MAKEYKNWKYVISIENSAFCFAYYRVIFSSQKVKSRLQICPEFPLSM